MKEDRFIPLKRQALDGKIWWCVWDTSKRRWSTCVYHYKYKTKKDCQFNIDYYNNLLN